MVIGDRALGVHTLLVVRRVQQLVEPLDRELGHRAVAEHAPADEQRFVLVQRMVGVTEVRRICQMLGVIADRLLEPSEVLGAVVAQQRGGEAEVDRTDAVDHVAPHPLVSRRMPWVVLHPAARVADPHRAGGGIPLRSSSPNGVQPAQHVELTAPVDVLEGVGPPVDRGGEPPLRVRGQMQDPAEQLLHGGGAIGAAEGLPCGSIEIQAHDSVSSA